MAGEPLGLVTIYRTLDLLAGLDLVRKVHLPDGCHAYAVTACSHGHHVVVPALPASGRVRGLRPGPGRHDGTGAATDGLSGAGSLVGTVGHLPDVPGGVGRRAGRGRGNGFSKAVGCPAVGQRRRV